MARAIKAATAKVATPANDMAAIIAAEVAKAMAAINANTTAKAETPKAETPKAKPAKKEVKFLDLEIGEANRIKATLADGRKVLIGRSFKGTYVLLES